VSLGQNVTVDVLIGSKCHSGRSELGRNVQAAPLPPSLPQGVGGGGGVRIQEFGGVVGRVLFLSFKKQLTKIVLFVLFHTLDKSCITIYYFLETSFTLTVWHAPPYTYILELSLFPKNIIV
jgi:hypothetical protein